ncbi:BRCT domain-containing protein [Naegleria gruberi]|uniref:BRCT domain-containing protein n=1 Tax=Naegleria gruberi TaxID=5762 RepID=D2UZG2_NAEGR|nr:BRCT domain-containing protein [Naegleria gruberi]EFC50142.1 BRCT domain-containing protein [Naegleria gruberi]|eukprot:XP_002682886.1 BRCT domain-containing protein [Naegleria gruberi strain NEG-M]
MFEDYEPIDPMLEPIEPASPIFASPIAKTIIDDPSSPILFGNSGDDSDNEEIKQTLEKLDYYSSSASSSQGSNTQSSSSSHGSSDDLCESFCYRSRTNKRTVARRRRSIRKESSQVLEESVMLKDNDLDIIYSSSSQDMDETPCGLFTGFYIIAPDFTPEEREQYSKLVKDNGGKMASIKKDFAWYSEGLNELANDKLVLISDSPKPRPSYLAALMLNIPLLKKEWIIDSLNQKSIITTDVDKYLLARGSFTTTDGIFREEAQLFNPTFQMLPKEKRPLYGVSVKINCSDVKFIDSWKKVLESGGATVGDIATYSSKHGQGSRNFVLVRDTSEISKQRLDYFNIKKVPILNKDSVIQMIISSEYNFEDLKITKLPENPTNKSRKPNLIIPPLVASLDDSLTSPFYTPTPTPSVIPNPARSRRIFDSSNNLASKWFSNVKQQDDSLIIQDTNASVLDIRTQSAKKKQISSSAASKRLNSSNIALNTSLVMNTSHKKIKLDKLERSFSTSFMNTSLQQFNTSMIDEPKSTFDDLSNLTTGDYFLKQEKSNQQKTCFVRLSKQKILCGKRKYEDSSEWKLDQYFVGDVVTVSGPFTDSSKFLRIDQLYYKDYVTESKEMLGTEYIPDANNPKKLNATSKTIRVDLSSINHKIFIGNLETFTTKKKRSKKHYYSDYVFKNFDFKEIEDASVQSLFAIPNELAQLSDLEMKRERRIKSVRMKNPFHVRFTAADFNGKIFEEGNYVKLHERDSKEPIICIIKEIRERDIAHFCNQFTNIGYNDLNTAVRPSPTSSVVVEILTGKNACQQQHYTFTHQVEEIMFARIHSMEPLVAIQKQLVGESFDLTSLCNQNDLIILE